MMFRHPIKNEFEALFSELDNLVLYRGADSVAARANIKILRAFVDMMEVEREFDTPQDEFLYGMLAVIANLLAATLKFSVERGVQAEHLPLALKILHEQVVDRLDKKEGVRVFLAGYDPKRARPSKGKQVAGAAAK